MTAHVTTASGAGTADRCLQVPRRGARGKDVLRFLSAALPHPPACGSRKRKDPSWEPLIASVSVTSSGRVRSGVPSSDERGRAVSLMTRLFRTILHVTVDDADAMLQDIALRLCRDMPAASIQDQRTLDGMIVSMDKMLQHTGQDSAVRRAVAAVACQVPQRKFTEVVTGTASRNSVLRRRQHRNLRVYTHQGRAVSRGEVVGLGQRARRSALIVKARLEAGHRLSEPTRVRFNPEHLTKAVLWLTEQAVVSSYLTRTVRLQGVRSPIPSMMLTQRPATLYTRYVQHVGNDARIGETLFRSVVSAGFSVSSAHRTAMDYMSLDFGERNFVAMREFVRASTRVSGDGAAALALVDQVQTFLEGDFADKVVMGTEEANTAECPGHHARRALLGAGDQTCCADCAVVDELCHTLKTLASSTRIDTDAEDANKMARYLVRDQAHLLRGKVQHLRCEELRQNLPPNRVHVILDFKMKWVPMMAREASGEWFGKKGICWHGAVVTLPRGLLAGGGGRAVLPHELEEWVADPSNDPKQQFVTVHDILHSETKQDSLTVLSILESLLCLIKRCWTGVTEVVVQTDNASCYCSNMLFCKRELIAT